MGTPSVLNWNPDPSLGPIDAGATVSFDAVDDTGVFRQLLVLVYFDGTNLVEVAWDNTAFTPFYNAASSATTVTDGSQTGLHFALNRAGGWPAAPRFVVYAIDTGGNEAPIP